MVVAKLFLVGVLALATVSCAATPRHEGAAPEAFEAEAVEDSGKRLSGDFVVAEVEDGYRQGSTQTSLQTLLTFDDKGAVKRQDKSRLEEGTYVIGSGNEFVIYIEKVNGEPLAAARVERYEISDPSGDPIRLQSPSRKLTLRRR